ncbi:MAG: mycothiol synthase [Acidimicrobiia bacterium]
MLSTRVLRPPAPEAVETIRALEAAAAAHDGHESLGSFAWRDLAAPSPESTGILAVDGAEQPVGYAHLAPSDTLADPHYFAGLVVHPEHRHGGAVAGALLGALTTEARTHGPERIVLWVNGSDDEFDSLAEPHGFKRVSEQFQMRVPLPLAESPAWPPGITVRSFVPGADDADWLRVNNRTFRNHPDQGSWAAATLQRRIAEPWFDADGFLLAYDADGLAGFCWTKVHDVEPDGRLGEIYVIGVDPDHQGSGLGRALTVGGLEHLARDRHCPTGMLYVDGANPPALGLYRALGFKVHRTDRAYEARPGPA